jgi:hypothetical protein
MKILKPLWHGVLDYGLALLFLLAPTLFGFEPVARSLSHAVGATYIVASLLTRYPLGMLKLIPFPAHGVLETIAALSWIGMPFFAGFADDHAARNFFICAGVALILVVGITDYQAASRPHGDRRVGGGERRTQAVPVATDRRASLFPRRSGNAR